MAERPQTNGETPVLDSGQAATLAYESLLVKLTSAEPAPVDIPTPREISDTTVEKVQNYLDNISDKEN